MVSMIRVWDLEGPLYSAQSVNSELWALVSSSLSISQELWQVLPW